MQIPTLIKENVVCPACYSHLDWSDRITRCLGCRTEFAVRDGIPILTLDPIAGASSSQDSDQKRQQALFFDDLDEKFETVRPHSTPRLHQWLLDRKFKISLEGLPPPSANAVALAVCGGSGMDAEKLTRAGYRTISSDISLQAAQRAAKRGQMFGAPITPIVCDAERLPFRDSSIELAYVHDGLHHLSDPLIGMREMMRVSSRCISINEPAAARLTTFAVKLGIAEQIEEAGNRVARLDLEETLAELSRMGFSPLATCRYAMYYKHVPGWVCRVLSTHGVFQLSHMIWSAANVLIGRYGNKLSIVAARTHHRTRMPNR